jgi:uncharacterized membrane protein YeiB
VSPPFERPRVIGIDVARGLALAGMLAVHVFPTFDSDGTASVATTLASGRGAAVFATMAGVGLALVAGRRCRTGAWRRVRRPVSNGTRVSLAVRAVLLLLLGLLLGHVTAAGGLDVYVILPYDAMMFLLAVPLLGLGARVLAAVSLLLAAAATFAILATVGRVADPSEGLDPTTGDALRHPLALLVLLLVGGAYPAVVWLAYITAGMAIGRLDLTSKRVAGWLLGVGATLSAAAWMASSRLLFGLGGLQHLRDSIPDGMTWTDAELLWEPWGDFDTYWWYAVRAPHSGAPLDMLHTLGFAVAVLGAALLVTRLPRAARLLRPLAAAGSMVLTLYCAHIVLMATGFLSRHMYAQYVVLLAGMVGFAVVWKRRFARGPLEELISRASNATRWALTRDRPANISSGDGIRQSL